MSFFTKTSERVSSNTDEAVNQRIELETRLRIQMAAENGPQAIDQRLAVLDREWDIERCLETGASSLSLFGIALGSAVNKKWFILPAAVTGFLLQHAIQGWCPPLAVLRRLGVRTADEINRERYALKALRGDFRGVDSTTTGDSVSRAFSNVHH
ncbi:MAG: hypothetical protein JWM78_1036 [Verrucomicrobiaceae bacterium]|nr:hypothetical protein [Verrucomicrobiaceae bacterium]